MRQTFKNIISKAAAAKKITLFLCTVLISVATVGSTFAYMVTGTPSVVNSFLSGFDPAGDLIIQKTVTHPFGDGYDIPEDLAFTFEVNLGTDYAGRTVNTTVGEITADEKGVIPVTVAPGGQTTIFDIDEGTDVTVTEIDISKGFTADPSSATITIQKYQNNTLAFENTYSPEKADASILQVSGVKTLSGREWMEGDSFTFVLEVNKNGTWTSLGTKTVTYELVEQQDPADPEKTVLVPKENFNKFDFSDRIQKYVFDKAGTYSFRVVEVEGTIGGIAYDKAESLFDVTVTDTDMDGYLEIGSVSSNSANTTITIEEKIKRVSITFENRYAPSGSDEVFIEIEKKMEDNSGQNASPAGFTFDLYDESGTLVKTSDPTGSTGKTSIKLVFEPENAGKTFIYTLKETNGGETIDYITYDDTQYKVRVSVEDNMDGTVSAYISEYTEIEGDIIEAPVTQEPEDSTVEEPTTTPSEPAAEEPVADEPETEETITDGEVQTPEEEPEAEEPIVEEPVVEEPVISEDEPVTEEPVIDGEEPASEEPAENTDDATPADIQEESPTTEEPVPEENTIVIQPLALELNPENETEDVLSVQPDEAVITDGEGVDDTEPEEPVVENKTDTYSVVFTNKYDPQDKDVSISGVKELSGRDLREKEFTFMLYKTDEHFETDDNPIDTARNDKDGKFTFDELTFSEIGTYYYAVKEDDSQKLGGITYDDSCYHITVVITDNNGVLESAVYITDSFGKESDIKFSNKYKADSVLLQLQGKKILEGAELKDDAFFFKLYKADEEFKVQGEVLKTAANKASGEFAFEKLPLTEAGVYRYIVKEDATAAVEGMEYDDTVYNITVTVTDPGNGQLEISGIEITADGQPVTDIVFENTYTAPEIPDEPDTPDEPTTPDDDKDVPETGDDTNTALYAGILVISVIALVIIIIIKKRKDKQ